jgi:hypothetical protein
VGQYQVTVRLRPTPPDFEAIEVTYVLKADSPEEAEAIIRRRLMRGAYGCTPHADWMIDVEEWTEPRR